MSKSPFCWYKKAVEAMPDFHTIFQPLACVSLCRCETQCCRRESSTCSTKWGLILRSDAFQKNAEARQNFAQQNLVQPIIFILERLVLTLGR